jgi:DNA-binding response OmpR family regulator
MYMASVEKQMLGTEAVQALRAKGVTSLICGLSANDKEDDFLAAGADAFTFKPFPCEKVALSKELLRILNQDHHTSQG